jgi:hypothetical protein
VHILGAVDDVVQVLEDSMVAVATIAASRFVAGIRCVCVHSLHWMMQRQMPQPQARGKDRMGSAWSRASLTAGLALLHSCRAMQRTFHTFLVTQLFQCSLGHLCFALPCPARHEVAKVERSLRLLSDTLDELLECQRQWLYLESIFGAADIQRQLPSEAKLFAQVHVVLLQGLGALHVVVAAFGCRIPDPY